MIILRQIGRVVHIESTIDDKLANTISRKLSYLKQNAKFMPNPLFGWVYLYNKKKQLFPLGLLSKVKVILDEWKKQKGEDYKIIFTDTRVINIPKQFNPILRPYQKEAVLAILNNRGGIVSLPTGCHIKGQGILMYNGTIKKVEDVIVGDKIMGPDSKPRIVEQLHKGREKMFQIIPLKGESFIVNKNHILSLVRTNDNKDYRINLKKKRISLFKGLNRIINISVNDYIKQSKSFKHLYKLYNCKELNFNNKNKLLIPPYILGIWLGDGHSKESGLTTIDREIKNIWIKYLKNNNLNIKIVKKFNSKCCSYCGRVKKQKGNIMVNKIHILLKKYNLLSNKHIPFIYKTASKKQRLNLLAGLIDTDGCVNKKTSYEITQKSDNLANDIVFLARSLGFKVYIRKKYSKCQTGNGAFYNRITIMGNNLNMIPCKIKYKKIQHQNQIKNTLFSGFKLKQIGINNYYGFSLSGDGLYLMDNFFITHNSGKSLVGIEILKSQSPEDKKLILVPTRDLVTQWKKQTKDIKNLDIDTYQMLYRHLDRLEQYKWIACDEVHRIAAKTLYKVGMNCKNAIVIGLSATPGKRSDGEDMKMFAVVGDIAYKISIEELVSKGYLIPATVYMLPVENVEISLFDEYRDIYKSHIVLNESRNKEIINTAKQQCENGTCIIMVDMVEHGENLLMLLKKELKNKKIVFVNGKSKDRDKIFKNAINDKYDIIIATKVYNEGINIPCIKSMILAGGGKGSIKITQQVGRLLRHYKDKTMAIIFDFDDNCCRVLKQHVSRRVKTYNECGFEVIYL